MVNYPHRALVGLLRSYCIFAAATFLFAVGFAPIASATVNIPDDETITSDRYGIHAPSDNAVSRDTIVGDNVTVYVANSGIISPQFGAGLYADGFGASVSAGDNLTVSTDGPGIYGLFANNFASIDIDGSAAITTSGGAAFGIFANDGGSVSIGRAAITTDGDGVEAIRALNGSVVEIGANSTIATNGSGSYTVYSGMRSSVEIGNNSTITSGIDGSYAVYAFTGTIRLGSGITISTSGESALGAMSASGSNIEIGEGVTIDTSGNGAFGVSAQLNSRMTVGNGARITTRGTGAHGAVATGSGSSVSRTDIGDDATIITYGNISHGVFAVNRSTLSLGDRATIITSGDTSHGVFANGGIVTVGSSADISTIGAGAHGVFASGGASVLLSGARISAAGAGASAIRAETGGAYVSGSGVYDISGDMFAGQSASIDIIMEDGSSFTGAAAYASNDASSELTLTMNGANTTWEVTANSELTNLYMDGATVDMTTGGLGVEMFVVDLGRSADDTGVFRMDADIAGEFADHLYVGGTAQGTYRIDVVNRGSQPALGTEITDLVFVNAGQPVVFVLDHIVELGGFQYELLPPDIDTVAAGGVLTPRDSHHDESAWYLRGNGRASVAGSGAINSFAGSYLMAYADTQTLIQRMGDLRQSPYGQGLWFRVHGGKFESNSKSYVRGFDMDYGGVQIGYDRKMENKWDGTLYTGIMFGYGKGDLDYHREGSGEVDSKTLGVYGTYIGRSGFYIDAILKYQWMTNDFDVIDTAGTLVRGRDVDTGGIGASVEFGQRLRVGEGGADGAGWYVEPQVQLSYQRQDGGFFNATNGLNIGVEPFTSILGRVGMLVGYETEKANFYAKASKVKEFDGDLNIGANGVPICDSFAGSWWVYGIGCSLCLNDRNCLYLDIERTAGGSFSQPWRVFAGWRLEL